jgi:DNA-binding transcriptional MerR regulator
MRIGLVRPTAVEGRVVVFGEDQVTRLRRIRRLRDDLGLNVAGIEVVMRLLDRLEAYPLEGLPAARSSTQRSAPDNPRADPRSTVAVRRVGGEPCR